MLPASAHTGPPATCCVGRKEWHLSIGDQGLGDFPLGVEDEGAEHLVQCQGYAFSNCIPTLPCRISDTGFRFFTVTAGVLGWKKKGVCVKTWF